MKLKERIFDYLRKIDKDVDRNDLIAVAEKAGYKRDMVYDTLKEIADTIANIGQWQDSKTRVTYIRWYKPNSLTNKVQECLDRGNGW